MSNKVHVNNSTRISLNDRFTIMQSVGVPPSASGAGQAGAPIMRRPRSRSRSRSVGRMAQPAPQMVTSPRVQAILPAPGRSRRDQYYEEAFMDRRQSIPRAPQQQMRTRPTLRNISAKQRLALAMANRGAGGPMAMRRPLRRLNGARPALATMRMDHMAASAPGRRGIRGRPMATATTLRQRRLNRAVATVNQAQLRQRMQQQQVPGRGGGRLSRMDLARSLSKAKMIRQRSRSRSNVNLAAGSGGRGGGVPTNLRRSNSRSNLQVARSQSRGRSNSRLNLSQGQAQQQQQPRRKINRDFQQRSRSRSRSRANAPSIASRLGVRPGNNNNNNKAAQNNGGGRQRQRSNSVSARLGGKRGVLNRVATGRVSKQQRLGQKPLPQQQKQQQLKKKNGNLARNQNGGGAAGKRNLIAKGRKGGIKNVQGAAAVAGKRQGKRPSALQQRLQKGGGRAQGGGGQQKKQSEALKARRGKRGAHKPRPLKKEDLDKELDKYMSTNN